MKLILGVDPGLDGAFALVDAPTGCLMRVLDMPTLRLKNGRIVDAYTLAAMVDDVFGVRDSHIEAAWIEKAWPRPGEASTLSFAFGKNYGQAMGTITANLIPLHEVGPALWKRAMGVTADKDEARAAASIRWPVQAVCWPLKKHHGRAEAALIAEYGRRLYLAEHRELMEAANA